MTEVNEKLRCVERWSVQSRQCAWWVCLCYGPCLSLYSQHRPFFSTTSSIMFGWSFAW